MGKNIEEHENINLHIRKSTFWTMVIGLIWGYISYSTIWALLYYRVPVTVDVWNFFTVGTSLGIIVLGISIIVVPIYVNCMLRD